MSENAPQQIGQLFKRARDDARIELEQAAAHLHIRAKYLRCIEQGDFSELPGAIYTRGYLRRYAAFLHLDEGEIIRRYEAIEGVPKRNYFLPKVFHTQKTPTPQMIVLGLAVALLVYILWRIITPSNSYDVSVVEPFPEVEVAHMVGENTCLPGWQRLYPPCAEFVEEPVRGLPLTPAYTESIMRLSESHE